MAPEILVSVVVPVFNVERYVAETIKSILDQTLTNIEVLCVNDGSTDNSAEIVEKFCAEDSRVCCIHQENQGLSAARNAGIQKAAGKYVYFLDSDDLIENDCLESLYQIAEENSLDMLLFDGETFYDDAEMEKKYPYYKNAYTRKNQYNQIKGGPDFFADMMLVYDFQPQASLYFYNRNFLLENELRFPLNMIHEDNLFAFHAFMKAKKAGYTATPFFKRRIRKDSIVTGKKTVKKVWGNYSTALMIIDYLIENSVDERVFRAACCLAKNRMLDAENDYNKLRSEEKHLLGDYFVYPGKFVLLFSTLESDYRTWVQMNGTIARRNAEITELKKVRAELNRQLDNLNQENESRKEVIIQKDQQIQKQKITIQNKNQKIKELKEQIKIKNAKIKAHESTLYFRIKRKIKSILKILRLKK